MKKVIYLFLLLLVSAGLGVAQVTNIADFNRADLADDPNMPYVNTSGVPANNGIRTVWVADDLDQDGKPEVIATDYSNNGRVHVMEINGDALEIVWSSPIDTTHTDGSGSTPRWVRTGDLDGDGNGEIIFPLSKGAADYKIVVYQWNGTDNGYDLVLTLNASDFASQGAGDFRMNREVASVYDFDGDGKDELITVNRDNNTYVLGITGNLSTGFAAWQIEGGANLTAPQANGGTITPGSEWHSVPADINGDGQIEIVNHHWNFYSFWSIVPTGADSYQYPDTTQDNVYAEMLNAQGIDGVAYMGIQPVDVDGDGKDELAGIDYPEYDLTLISFDASDDPQYSWDTSKFAIIGDNLWELAGSSAGSFWGIGAADLNGNGRPEILLGGSNGYNVVSVEYNGSGSVLDGNNYTKTIIYAGGHINRFSQVTISDSSGAVDTSYGGESPFISKMFAGSDINGNGKLEIAASYQSVFDSITYVYQHWADTAYVEDSTVTALNSDQVTVRLLESDVSTGIKEINLAVVSPDDYKLEQNYPNPFNPTTNIRFTLPLSKKISLKVYDILGNEVKTLINNQDFQKGAYEVTWDGTNNFGNKVASGQYIYTLKYGNFAKSMKMTLLK